MSGTQSVYVVTCINCSKTVEVVNPRIGVEPISVEAVDWEGLLPSGKVVYTRCPECGHTVKAQFIYRDSW